MAQSRRKSKRKGSKSSSGFGLFVMGMIVGSLGTVLGLGFVDRSPLDVGSGLGSLLTPSSDTTPASVEAPAAPAATDSSPLEFDYHELLLEEEYVLTSPQQPQPSQPVQDSEVAATETTSTSSPTATQSASQPAAESGSSYVIQVGSFRKFEDADRVKATLALSGLEAFIQKVTVEGRGEFYRVRLGPFDEYAAAERTTANLTELNYQPLVFRVKASG